MMEALAKLGVIDLSDQFAQLYAFEPDLLCNGESAETNLLYAVRRALLHCKEMQIIPKDPLYLVSTKQGVHIEIPGILLRKIIGGKGSDIAEEIVEAAYLHNQPKLEIVRRYQ